MDIVFRIYDYLCYRWELFFFHNLAISKLRHGGISFNAHKIHFRGPCHIRIHSGRGTIGDDFICNSGVRFGMGNGAKSKIAINQNGYLMIGKQSGMSNTVISCHEKITIGDFVNIGEGCLIMDSNFHSTNWHTREDRQKEINDADTAPINIGNHVFVGARCIICKGVTIGNRSIIAAGSVVVKDIPSDCIAGGNPCKVITTI